MPAKPEKELPPQAAIHILVNTRKRPVKGREISYGEVVDLAFPPPRSEDPDTYYSVTYSGAAQEPSSGEIGPGGSVQIKEGTAFRVTKTTKS